MRDKAFPPGALAITKLSLISIQHLAQYPENERALDEYLRFVAWPSREEFKTYTSSALEFSMAWPRKMLVATGTGAQDSGINSHYLLAGPGPEWVIIRN
jgi:hypothetical protein